LIIGKVFDMIRASNRYEPNTKLASGRIRVESCMTHLIK